MMIKTKLISLFVIVFLIIAMFLVYYDLLQKKEQRMYYVNDLTQRRILLNSFFQNRKNSMLRLADDYSLWDELTDFIANPASDWAKDYIEPILYIHGNDVVWLYNEMNELVFFSSSFEKTSLPTIETAIFSYVKDSKLSHFFIQNNAEVLEIAAATIHSGSDDERKTFPAGFMIFGKLYHERFLAEMENQLNYKISIKAKPGESKQRASLSNVVLEFPLLDFQKKPISSLFFYQHNTFLESLQSIHQNTLILFLVCATIFLIGLYLLFHFWIQKPLAIIAGSLQTEEQSMLKQIAANKNEFGKISSLIIRYFDQTRQLQKEMQGRLIAKQQLLETTDRFYKIFQHSPDLIIIASENVILEANDSFYREIGISEAETIGKKISEIDVFPKDWQTLPSKKNVLISLQAKDDRTIETLALAEVIDFNQKKCILFMFRNITEELKIEKKMIQAQKMEAVSSLAAGIAHDFNNILNVIMGYTAALKQKSMPNSEQFEKLSLIDSASQRAHDLVEQIVLIGKNVEQILQPVKFSVVLQQAIKFIRSSIPATIDLQISISSDAFVYADPAQLHHLIINICTNAYQAIDHTKGVVLISLTEANLAETENRFVRLRVVDNGCGIAKSIGGKIFDPYFSTRDSSIGLGLGLAIVKGIVENANGFIEVKSEEGKGSQFDFYFPVFEVTDKSESSSDEVTVIRNKTVMFVEDEEDLLSLFQETLIDADFDVIAISDSRKALDLYFEHKDSIDIIITDSALPKLSGLELIKKIRIYNPTIPIILYSGFKTAEIEKAVQDLNIFAFLKKPIIPAKMIALIYQALTDDK